MYDLASIEMPDLQTCNALQRLNTQALSLSANLFGKAWELPPSWIGKQKRLERIDSRWRPLTAYGTLRNETKRNEMVLCKMVFCEMVLFRKIPFRKVLFRKIPFRKIRFRFVSFRFVLHVRMAPKTLSVSRHN